MVSFVQDCSLGQIKMEQQTSHPPKTIKDETTQSPKRAIFPSLISLLLLLFGGGGGGEWFPFLFTFSKIVACLAVAVCQGEFISFREITRSETLARQAVMNLV